MPAIDDDGQIVTTSEDEYITEDDEYTDGEEGDYIDEEDGQIEELDGDEEELEDEDAEDIVGIPRGGPAASRPEELKEWRGLTSLPAATQQVFQQVISELRSKGKREVTILLLGKNGVGKSSTGNSLLNEQAFVVTPFQQDVGRPVTAVRRHPSGFVLRIIDTPSLLDGDSVSERALQLIQEEVAETPVDVVMYVDRLDMYRVEPADHTAMEAVARVLGADVWRHTILCMTRSQLTSPPPDTTYESFLEQRVAGLQRALAGAGGPSSERPVALIENSSKCNTNTGGEKVLPDGSVWLAALFQQIAEQASTTQRPFRTDCEAAAAKANPNRRGKWWIPIIFAAQIALKVFVLDRLMEDDAVRGDENGPFDAEHVELERTHQKQLKEERKQKAAAAKQMGERQRAARLSGSGASGDEESEEEDYEESEEESSEEEPPQS